MLKAFVLFLIQANLFNNTLSFYSLIWTKFNFQVNFLYLFIVVSSLSWFDFDLRVE